LNLQNDFCSRSPALKKKWVMTIFIFFLIFSANGFSDNINSTTIKKGTISNSDRQTITIQVISYKKATDADRELKRLESLGLDAIVSYELIKDKGMFYRVYVGQFENRKTALSFANGLVEKGIISGFWVKKTKAFVETVQDPEAKQDKTPKKTIETQQRKEIIETVPKKASPPQSPIEALEMVVPLEIPIHKETDKSETTEALPKAIVQEEVAPPEIQKPKTTDKIETEEALHEVIVRKKVGSAISASTIEKNQEKNRLSIGIKSRLSSNKKADDFVIKKTSGNHINTWLFEDTHKYGGLVVNFQLNDRFAIESCIERGLFTELELWQLSLGPIFQFPQIGLLTPFIRGGLVVGDLKWDDAPGDFDTGMGWEGGIGIYLIKSKIKIGIETTYQQMKYTYNKPSGQEIAVTDDLIDMSGYALLGTLSYLF